MKPHASLLVLAGALCLAGCVTFQMVGITTPGVNDAKCGLMNAADTSFLYTPGAAVVKRSESVLTVTCRKAGYQDVSVVIPPTGGSVPYAELTTVRMTRLESAQAEALRPLPTLRDGEFKDCADCPAMAVIPAGTFMMGSRGFDADGPPRQVTIPRAFAVGKFEITREEYGRFVSETIRPSANGCVGDRVPGTFQVGFVAGLTWEDPGFAQTPQDPVVCVSFDDAQAYVDWLSKKTNEQYGLLSEAEWEYAARAGTRTERYWGESSNIGCAYANASDIALRRHYPSFLIMDCDDGYPFTAPVGNFRPNAFGLYDMLGNVWEWTRDCYQETLDKKPTDGRASTDGNCEVRDLRGGGWADPPVRTRSADRYKHEAVTYRNVAGGFRVTRTP